VVVAVEDADRVKSLLTNKMVVDVALGNAAPTANAFVNNTIDSNRWYGTRITVATVHNIKSATVVNERCGDKPK
jgi:hypothetical protein